MRSDVPVGAFLSSGIDSTAVVALAREFNPNILTFTVGYDVPGYSEIEVAQDSARHLGVTTIPTKIGPPGHDGRAAQDRLAPGRPGRRPGAGAAVLRGQEGRRVRHRGALRRGRGRVLRRLHASTASRCRWPASTACPTPVQRGLRAVSKVIPEGVKGKSFLERGTTPIEERYYGNARIFTEDEKRRLLRRYDPAVRYTDVTAPLYAEAAGLDDVTKMQYVDLYTWLRGDILVKADRMSMAHSLEVRVPFLDTEVFDVAADRAGGAEAAAALGGHQVRAAPGAARAWSRRPIVNRHEARLPDADPGLAARARCTTGPATILARSGRRRAARPGLRAAPARRPPAGRRRPLPQGLDRADLLPLARHLRRAHARPGRGPQPVGPAHQAEGRAAGRGHAVSPTSGRREWKTARR